MTDAGPVDLAAHYLETTTRISELVRAEADRLPTTAVPACPGWSAQDVVAHITAIVEDALAGTLAGIPSDEQTAEQVRSRRDRSLDELLDPWLERAPDFASVVADLQIWPAVLDVLTHEQDLRGALGRPGARDTRALRDGLDAVVPAIRVPLPIRITTERRDWRCGDDVAPPTGLRTTDFELFRVLFGRRSRDQMLALDWNGDPAPVVDHLYVFGPAPVAIVE